MTATITRSPLQALSMSSMQQRSKSPRRRSARLAFEDEEAGDAAQQQQQQQQQQRGPAKKAKVHEDGSSAVVEVATSSNSITATNAKDGRGKKTAASGTKKAKASYNEDADGFQFARAPKTKKAAPKRRSSVKTGVAPQHGADGNSASQQHAPFPNGSSTSHPTRRSARLSGEKAVDEAAPEQQTHQPIPAHPSLEARDDGDVREGTRTPQADNEVPVAKKRRVTKIALPFADTPVILRNKEMRKTSHENRRRSSSQMRGQRASSLIDSGTSNALPHSEVEASEFYKHIHQDLPEPRRMKQLLIWCGTRALPEKPSGTTEDVNAALAARVIQEELLQEFSNKSEMSDWFSRDDVTPAAVVKKPNPRNIQNAAKLMELENEVKRLKQEKASWDTLLGSLASSVAEETSRSKASVDAPSAAQAPSTSTIDASLLSSTEQAALSELTSDRDTLGTTALRLEAATKGIEFKIDSFAEGMHKLDRYKETADGLVSSVLSASAKALQARDDAVKESAGTEMLGIRDVLRSLSRAPP